MPRNANTPSSDTRRTRPLSALEKMFWYADQGHPNHFCIIGEVAGTTTIADWRSALSAAIERSPLARSRIQTDANGAPVLMIGEADGVTLDVWQGDAGAWRTVVQNQLVLSFDVANGPLIRAVLLWEDDRATLVLAAHHAIADGLALAFLLRDIVAIVGGAQVSRSAEARPSDVLVAERSWAIPEVASAELPAPTLFRRFDGSRPHIATATLEAETTDWLRRRCRAEGATMHCLLAAVVATAMADLRPQTGVASPRILSPLDLRKNLLGSSEHLGLCLVGAVTQDDRTAADCWSFARRLANTLGTLKTPEGLLYVLGAVQVLEPHLTSVDQAREILACAFGCDVLLTNLGVLDFPETYGALRLDAVWGPSVMMGFDGEQTIGVATHAGRLNLVHTSYTPVAGLLPEVVRLLTTLED